MTGRLSGSNHCFKLASDWQQQAILHTSRNDNDNKEDDDAGDQTHAHLHVLPPHLFPDSVCSPPESLGGDREIVGLVLQGIEPLASLGYLVNIFSHHTDRVIDLL